MATNAKHLAEIGRKQRLDLLQALRRSGAQGLSVKALAAQFGMSYMGIKQHCLRLEKDGYLETERRHKELGRPELIYRLSPRAYGLIQSAPPSPPDPAPTAGDSTVIRNNPNTRLVIELLAAVRHTYGASAPEKLLFTLFQRRAENYAAQLPPHAFALADRAAALARIRDAEGHLASLETGGNNNGAANGGHEDSNGINGGNGRAVRPLGSSFNTVPAAGPLRIVEHDSPLADLLPRFPILARLERELFERVLFCPVQREDESTPGHYRCVFRLGR